MERFAAMTDEDMLCKTCGFVMYEDDSIVVVTSCHHDTEVGTYTTIPVECIRFSTSIRRDV